MSTRCFMSRIGKGPGYFTLAMLLGALLALLCLLPTAAFARAGGQTGAHTLPSSPTIPGSVLNKVGVSVVRLIANYGTGSAQVTCTGLGTLVASQVVSAASPYYQDWVLTDGSLASTEVSDCGKIGVSSNLNSIQIWASSGYTNGSTIQLGGLTCNNGSVVCTDSVSSTLSDSITPPTANPSKPYTLLSFQSKAGEPYVGLSSATDETGGNTPWNIGLTNASGVAYPAKNTGGGASSSVNFKDYLVPTPVLNPPAGAPGTPNSSTLNAVNAIEGGTPEINPQGQLVGMWANNGSGGYTLLSAETLNAIGSIIGQSLSATPTVSVQTCTVAVCWNAGIDAFYQSPATQATYTQAHEDLSKVSILNPQFIAAQNLAALAQQRLSVVAKKVNNVTPAPTPTRTSSSGALGIINQYQWQLVGAGVIVLVLLFVVLVLIVRAQKHRRALAQFDAEVTESRRIAAEQEAQRLRAQQPVAQVTCPNCHNAVQVTDAICPYCRFPLSPTASGMGVRLMGNAPVVSSPLSPVPPISERPTVLFPPHSPATPSAELSEPTLKHKQAQVYEDATQEIQHVHGRNLSLAVGTRSDPGIKRKHKPNEDSLFAMQGARTHDSSPQQFGLFVVADGMGGHANGQDASRLAIQTIIDFMLPKVSNGEQMDDEAFLKLMGDGVQASNEAVYNSNLEAHADMGTTMTAALVIGAMAYVANVGDSRTYLYRTGQGLSKVTHDHSVVASLVDAGIIKPDDVYTHPKRNQIYRSLGEKQMVEVDTFPVNLLPGDKLLLCSDGLWDMVRDPLIQDVLAKPAEDPNETGQKLIKAALNGGGEDNVSVIVVQFAEMNAHTGMTGVQLLAKPESVTVPNLPPL